MPDFKGSKCLVCKKEFTDSDDIVVCPECGTPYHRECYKKAGKCVNEALLQSGEAWSPDSENKAAVQKRICIRCHAENPDGSLYCNRCGMPFNTPYTPNIGSAPTRSDNNSYKNQNGGFYNNLFDSDDNLDEFERNDGFGDGFNVYRINFSDPLCGLNPSEKYSEDVNLAELGAYVDKNTMYYLPKFKYMKETGRYSSINFSALFFPQFYFAYRKMPFMSLLSMIVIFVTSVPQFLLRAKEFGIDSGILGEIISMFDMRGSAFSALLIVSYLALMAFRVTIAVRANKIYFDLCMKKIPKVKASVPENVTLAALHHSGGTSAALLTVMITIYFLASAALSFLITSSMTV